jgi:hypothetical protein
MNADDDKPPSEDAGESAAEVREPRQFSIHGFLCFTLLCALWCPQPMIFKGFWEAPQGFDLTKNIVTLASVFLAWAILLLFCFRQRFYGIFVCHLLLPFAGTLYVLFCYGHRYMGHGFVLFVLAMNLVCFPGAVLAMISRWLRPAASRARPGNRITP